MMFYLWSLKRVFLFGVLKAQQIRSESVKVTFLFFPFFYSSFFIPFFWSSRFWREKERKWCLRCHGLNTLLLYCVIRTNKLDIFKSIQHEAHIVRLFERGTKEEKEEKEDYPTKKKESSSSTTTTTKRRGGRGGRVHLERAGDVGTHEEHDFVVIIIIIIILVDDDDDDDTVENVERSVDENERSGRFSLGRKSVESDERIKRRDY